MAIGGPTVENFWPPMDIDNFRSENLGCGTFKCQKMGKYYMQFSRKICYNVFRKNNYAIEVPNSTIFEDMDAELVSNDAAS